MHRKHKLLWLAPLALYSLDAQAWGLFTHIYFAQSLLWAMPLLDPKLQRAIRRFPELVMAGACLPDLAIVSPAFRYTHQWENCQHLLQSATSDEETAIAIGYASHLYIDVIAHNHFVPAHEAMWLQHGMLTHIAVEWAMDGHLGPLVDTSPHQLLSTHSDVLVRFLAPRFKCSEQRATIAIQSLAKADRLLRALRLPQMIYFAMRLLKRRAFSHFVYYIAKTQVAMAEIGNVFSGERPSWEPELNHLTQEQMIIWRKQCLHQLNLLHPQPIIYYTPDNARIYQKKGYQRKDSLVINVLVNPAIKPPISAPATTSVG
jgi:hypothetical protein